MGVIVWIIFGALIGWLYSLLVDTDRQPNMLYDMLSGIIGALIGGFMMNMIGFGGITSFNLYSLILAILGALVSLWTYRMFAQSTSSD